MSTQEPSNSRLSCSQVRRSRLFPGLALLALLAATGAAGEARAVDLSGCWHGHWESCTTGHSGPLNANFCRVDNQHYRVDFSGRFFKLVPFRYSVTLTVVADLGDHVELSGSSYLGRLMGTFSYRATATACSFVSNYSSCKDQGRFVLAR
jgi:hypothetical protein